MSKYFKVNTSGMRAITRTMGQPAAMQAARRGKVWAEAHAPVRTGAYKASFQVIPAAVGKDGRQGARLVNGSDHAFAVEWGYGAKHILAQSINAIEGK